MTGVVTYSASALLCQYTVAEEINTNYKVCFWHEDERENPLRRHETRLLRRLNLSMLGTNEKFSNCHYICEECFDLYAEKNI